MFQCAEVLSTQSRLKAERVATCHSANYRRARPGSHRSTDLCLKALRSPVRAFTAAMETMIRFGLLLLPIAGGTAVAGQKIGCCEVC